jgi:hypothetical protein
MDAQLGCDWAALGCDLLMWSWEWLWVCELGRWTVVWLGVSSWGMRASCRCGSPDEGVVALCCML